MNIKNILFEQKLELNEIMNKKNIIPRDIINQFDQIRESNLAKIVTGIRRSGKSTLLYLLLKDKDYGYINFDDINLYGRDASEIFNSFIELYGNVKYVFLDEIQNLTGWELFVNNLQKTYNVFITGSNSKLLSSELSSSLTGRHIQIQLFPFNFKEFIKYKNNLDTATNRGKNIIKNNLTFYMENGGFPEILIENESRNVYLTQLYRDIIEKDIIIRFNINHKRTYIDIVNFIMNAYTGYISYNKVKNKFNVGSVHTVKNYINYLEESYLVFFLDKFSYKEIEIEKSVKKVYLIDNGFIQIINRNSSDLGKSLENVIAINLKQLSLENNFNIYYWKDYNNNEVDFIIKMGIEIKLLMQVTYAMDEKDISMREIRALIQASDILKCDNLVIITWDYSEIKVFNDKKINFIPAWQWLLTPNI